jgi:hypothetical protein
MYSLSKFASKSKAKNTGFKFGGERDIKPPYALKGTIG